MEKKICQYAINGNLVARYDSIKLAAISTGMSAKSISRCCTGKRRSYNGFVWMYANVESADQILDYFKSDVSDLDGEIWRDIAGFEGLYQVSSEGRVKSLKRAVDVRFGNRFQKEQIVSFELDKDGYEKVQLCKDGKQCHRLIHRLVCMAFVENKNNLPEVNHINGIKTDNRIDNLEWCTRSENEQHAYDMGLAKGQKGHLRPLAKPVRIVNSITNEVLKFGCIADCARFFKGKQRNLEAAIRGRASGAIKKLLNGYYVEFIN